MSFTPSSAALLDLATADGFAIVAPEPLVHPAFPDTFAPSGFHNLVRRASQVDGNGPVAPSAGVQWVYRHVDLQVAPHSPAHLLAFNMFVSLEAHEPSGRRPVVERNLVTLQHLLDLAGIGHGDLVVTLFGGHREGVTELGPDGTMASAWRAFGLESQQILPLRGPALYGLTRMEGELAGYRSEVFAHHPTLGSVEIATMVTETCVTGGAHVATDPLPMQVSGIAAGLERLQLFKTGSPDILRMIQRTPSGSPFLARELGNIHRSSIAGLLKGLHAAAILYPELARQPSPPHVHRYRQLLRAVERHRQELGLRKEELDALYGSLRLDEAVAPTVGEILDLPAAF